MNLRLEQLGHVGKEVINMMSKVHTKELDVSARPRFVKCDTNSAAEQTRPAFNGFFPTGNEKRVIHSDIIGRIQSPLCGSA